MVMNQAMGTSPPAEDLIQVIEQIKKEQDKVQNLLSSLGFALRSFHNLNQFLELIPLMAARVADGDGGALIFIKDSGEIRLEQLHCQNGQSCQPLRQALEVITRNQMTQSYQRQKEQRHLDRSSLFQEIDLQIKEFLGDGVNVFHCQILVKNQLYGQLYVFSHDPDYAWNTTRKKLVQLIADQTAVAIANHQLNSELRQKVKQDRELKIASEIQSHLLPKDCPRIKGAKLAAGFKTANQVSGDYYDFIPTSYDCEGDGEQNHQKWGIVIGDVMGKGVPAGLIMTMTRGMLRAEVLNGNPPAQILQHLSRVMYKDLESSNRFVTLFYSEYDPQTRILKYSNAAHNPPLWWRSRQGSLEKLDTDGMLVGIEPETVYGDGQAQLEPGDVVVYYTDGFTDAVNQDGDRFDEENLLKALKIACSTLSDPDVIKDYMFAKVAEFVGAEDHNEDDITLVVLKVLGSN
jgi:sigma-B regulation protein RsbU (phosphoserine phosphatase)